MIPITLAIDYGTKRVGLAISRASLADPLMTIANDEQLFPNLVRVCEQEGVSQVVVGLSENTMAELTLEFVDQLKSHINIPIQTTDETLSSQVVEAKLRTTRRGRRQQVIDHFAAAEFLQAWLDEQEG
jgi:putative transcription antitermination factor YqgF